MRNLFVGDEEEVDVAVLVEVAARQRAEQVRADEAFAEYGARALQHFPQQRIDLRVRLKLTD